MSDFLIYHNPERMGYPATTVKEAAAVTDKQVGNDALGDRVWLLTGEGQPRKYYLVGWFEIDGIEPNWDREFRTRIVGQWRAKLPRTRWVLLNKESWFPEFRQKQGNFAFGFQPITTRSFVQGLEKALSRAKR